MINKMLHPGQIPTTLKYIRREIWFKSHRIKESLTACMMCDIGSDEYKNHLVMTAMLFEHISCLVYKGRDGKYIKPSEDFYKKEIFEPYLETPDEVQDAIERLTRKTAGSIAPDLADKVHRMIWQVADIVCPMMACMGDQAFISEYAYAIDYVIRHDGDLEKPVIRNLFPQNYSDFRYQEGIGDEVSRYE